MDTPSRVETVMTFEIVVPDELKTAYEVFKFSPGVIVRDRLIMSGQIGVNPDLSVPESLEEELENAFSYIGLILSKCDLTFADVAELQSFHVTTSLMADVQVFNAVRSRFMSEPHCAWTTVGVESLLIPGARVEIRAQAVFPHK
jgi:enamine deaminase RidA (YjgF/YER057c/UK114 family)